MLERLEKWTIKFCQFSFIKVTRQTLLLMFPIAFVGTLALMFKTLIFTEDSFFNDMFYVESFMPSWLWTGITTFIAGLEKVAFDMFGVMVAYGAARYTAKLYHKDAPLAGMTGFVTMLLLSLRYNRLTNSNFLAFDPNLLNVQSVLFSLVVGYGVGQIYHWLGAKQVNENRLTVETVAETQRRTLNSLKPLFLSLLLGAVIGAFFNWIDLSSWLGAEYTWLENLGRDNQSLWLALPMIAVSLLLSWLGIGGPDSGTGQELTSAAAANLKYALIHGSAWHVPYKYLSASLYDSFANFGGSGLMLALVIALIIVSKRQETQQLARWNLFPVIFNSNYGLMIGLPTILNPVLLLPYVLLPIANMLLATVATFLHLVPATPYPIPVGTPGILAAFVGSNGSWSALTLAILLLIFDVWAYLPFVRAALRIENQINLRQKAVTL